jgi:hypothetical protein
LLQVLEQARYQAVGRRLAHQGERP